MRIARFHVSNEFGDWDTALHTFTFANAVEQGLRRAPSPELLRGVLDAAASVYLDRFLNVPATRLPRPDGNADAERLLADLPELLDQQQQVNEAGELAAAYLATGADPDRLVAVLGACLLRENRNFHTIQCVEAACRQHTLLRGTDDAALPLIAASRYLADHALAAPDVPDRPAPAPRREDLRGRDRLALGPPDHWHDPIDRHLRPLERAGHRLGARGREQGQNAVVSRETGGAEEPHVGLAGCRQSPPQIVEARVVRRREVMLGQEGAGHAGTLGASRPAA
jgi:hypothetical protein